MENVWKEKLNHICIGNGVTEGKKRNIEELTQRGSNWEIRIDSFSQMRLSLWQVRLTLLHLPAFDANTVM